jgi:hypothetical protein
MEKKFHVSGRIREISNGEGQLNFMVDSDRGLTAQINLLIDKDCKNKADAFNLLVLYGNFLTKVEPDKPIVIDFVYDKDYNAEEPWLGQRHYNDDIHHVVQCRFSGIVKNVTVEVTISGSSAYLKNKIDGFLGSLRISSLTMYDDSMKGDVLSFEE